MDWQIPMINFHSAELLCDVCVYILLCVYILFIYQKKKLFLIVTADFAALSDPDILLQLSFMLNFYLPIDISRVFLGTLVMVLENVVMLQLTCLTSLMLEFLFC